MSCRWRQQLAPDPISQSLNMAVEAGRKPVTAVLIGAGNRGTTYALFALDCPDRLQIVSVAEPNTIRRDRIVQWFAIPPDRTYDSWTELAAREKMADCAIITTQDQMHRDPAVSLAEKGYDILLEKPMAVSAEDCRQIAAACQMAGVMLAVCHVMRYFPPVAKIKEIIDSGVIRDVVSIQHTENVGFWHFAHSFVRGNWRKTSTSTFSLLSKCCHDMDLICHWMGTGKKCVHVTSVGSLFHFKRENQPQGASDYCLSCPVEPTCPYSAKRIYLTNPGPHWPMAVVRDVEDLAPEAYRTALEEELRTGPYGRCVYKCDNDVNDNQVVTMRFSDGSTASLTMIAFTKELCERRTKVWGTKGELEWDGTAQGPIIHYDFLSRRKFLVNPDQVAPPSARCRGHGGADYFLMDAFVSAVSHGKPELIRSGPIESLESHLLVFAAQDAQNSGRSVEVDGASWRVL